MVSAWAFAAIALRRGNALAIRLPPTSTGLFRMKTAGFALALQRLHLCRPPCHWPTLASSKAIYRKCIRGLLPLM